MWPQRSESAGGTRVLCVTKRLQPPWPWVMSPPAPTRKVHEPIVLAQVILGLGQERVQTAITVCVCVCIRMLHVHVFRLCLSSLRGCPKLRGTPVKQQVQPNNTHSAQSGRQQRSMHPPAEEGYLLGPLQAAHQQHFVLQPRNSGGGRHHQARAATGGAAATGPADLAARGRQRQREEALSEGGRRACDSEYEREGGM